MASYNNKPNEEQEAFLHHRRVQKTKGQKFAEFIYDKNTHKFLGRDGKSWLEITLFYIIFYAFLAAFWAFCCAVFVWTLDDKVPRYYGKGTIIGINPGMGYQPWIKEDPESTLIHFNRNDPKSYEKYVNAMDTYLSKYENRNHTRMCNPGRGNVIGESNNDNSNFSCRFEVKDHLGACNKANNFGYSTGEPCVALTLNRLIGWTPVAYPKNSYPAEVQDRYNQKDIAIYCHGENPADNEHIGEVQYFPASGLQGEYFPYKVMANYHQPIAMVQFKNISRNQVVQVECLAYAYNIIHDVQDRQGMSHFEIMMDELNPSKTAAAPR